MEFILICISVITIVGFATTFLYFFYAHKEIDLNSSNIQSIAKTIRNMRDIQRSVVQVMMSPWLNSLGVPDKKFCVPIKRDELPDYKSNIIIVDIWGRGVLLVGTALDTNSIRIVTVYANSGQMELSRFRMGDTYHIEDGNLIYALMPPK